VQADADTDELFGDVLVFSSSRDFAAGMVVTTVSEGRFLRFTLSPDDSWPQQVITFFSIQLNTVVW